MVVVRCTMRLVYNAFQISNTTLSGFVIILQASCLARDLITYL